MAHLKGLGQSVTFRRISERIPLQYTFLSKVLNQPGHHLSQDHLFKMAKILDFLPEEIDYLDLLRSYSTTEEPDRKSFLFARIEKERKKRAIQAEHQDFSDSSTMMREMRYLFEPMAVIVHVALWMPVYQRDPRRLCSLTGMNPKKLLEILDSLDMLGYIRLGEDPFEVVEVFDRDPHYGRDNPLMRAHQAKLKTQMISRLNQTSEEEKESFMVAFTADEEAREKINQEFKKFIQNVREISQNSKEEHLYQMSFDFLKWF